MYYCRKMKIPIGNSVRLNMNSAEIPPTLLTSKNIMWITTRRFYFLAINTRIRHYCYGGTKIWRTNITFIYFSTATYSKPAISFFCIFLHTPPFVTSYTSQQSILAIMMISTIQKFSRILHAVLDHSCPSHWHSTQCPLARLRFQSNTHYKSFPALRKTGTSPIIWCSSNWMFPSLQWVEQ